MRRLPAILLMAALRPPIWMPAAAAQAPSAARTPVPPPLARSLQLPRRPKVVDLPYDKAVDLLQRLHITVVRRDTTVGVGRPGVVLRQSPAGGTPVAPGAVDTLVVSLLRVLPPDVWHRATEVALTSVPPPLQRPSVVGFPYAKAEAVLHGLRITVVGRDTIVPSGSDGIVLRQSPAAKTPVIPGAVDTLTVSRLKTPRLADVPDVVHAPYGQAVLRIRSAGLAPAGPTLTPADSARARVSQQDPAAPRQAPLGSAVRLAIALDDRTAVPRVIGADTATARGILARAELGTGPVTPEFDDRFAVGLIFHQDPTPGDSVKRGTAVRLMVSRGPHPDTTLVRVPSVLRLSLDRATATLREQHLAVVHVDTVERPDGEGRVVTQDPRAGDTAHVGDALRLTITVPRPTVPVPHLVGRTRSAAQRALQSVGLTLGAVKIVTDPKGPDGLVVHQSVPEETRLPLREPVGIDLNLRPPPERVTVPSVLGLRLKEASESLVRSRLTAGKLTDSASSRSDIVLDQGPKAGARVEPGSAVGLVVGRISPPAATAQPPALPGVSPPRVAPPRGAPPRNAPPIETGLAPKPTIRESLLTTPAVVDSTLPRALAILERAGLHHVEVDSQRPTVPDADWVVDSQRPQRGERVLADALVQLRARAIPRARVPDLIGLSEGEAGVAATREGLGFRVANRTTTLRLAGTYITAQAPAADSQVAPGTPIDVTVADPLPPLVTLGVALTGLAGAAGVVRRLHPLKPRFRTSVTSELPELAGMQPPLARAEVALRVQVEAELPEVNYAGAGLIQREERRDA